MKTLNITVELTSNDPEMCNLIIAHFQNKIKMLAESGELDAIPNVARKIKAIEKIMKEDN